MSEKTFDKVQDILNERRVPLPDYEILRRIREAWRRKGALSATIIRSTSGIPDPATLYRRFGTLEKIYQLIGFKPDPSVYKRKRRGETSRDLRDWVLREICELHRNIVTIHRLPGKHRKMILLDGVIPLSIYTCVRYETELKRPGWIIDAPPEERNHVSLLCLQDEHQQRIIAYYLMPPGFRYFERMKLRPGTPSLRKAIELSSLADLKTEAHRLWSSASLRIKAQRNSLLHNELRRLSEWNG